MPAIKIENLSKKYVIGHQKQERYTALRDVMMHKMRGIGQRLRHPLSPNREEIDVEEFWALKDINLEIEQGDRVGIIGRNGAGKSTLLKVLSRITEPTSGKIHLNGRVASLLEVGTGFHPELSGRENVYLNGAILGMGRVEIKRKFDEIVDFSGVEKFLDTPVKRYSSGMYVRLAFAVAAHLEPEILIVDEVLAVGDAQFQKKCLGKMEEVGKEGRTVLFVSHNMAAIKRLCSRCVYLEGGSVVKIGDTSTVVGDYLSSGFSGHSGEVNFTGGEEDDIRFISSRTMNLDGTVKNHFRSDEDILVSVTYQVKRQMFGVSLVINILTGEQESLWSMGDWEEYPELLDKREPGIWTGEWIVPANILKPDRYFIACGAGNQSVAFHHPEPFRFEITPEGTWRPGYKHFGVGGGPLAYKMTVNRPVRQSADGE